MPTSWKSAAPAAIAVCASAAGSCACAALLHVAVDRSDAAWIPVVAWPWAVVVLAALWRKPVHRGLPWLIGAALLVRLPQVGTPWLLSDDAWRFLWEGAVLASGHNPFVTPASALPGIDDALRARVNHPEITSIYPPLALVWFRLLHALGSPAGAQLATLTADLIAVGTLWRLSDDARMPWLYALHPLPVLEGAGSAHLEAPALALVGAGLIAWRRGSHVGAWLGIGGGAAFKLLPGLVLPNLLRRPARGTALGMAALAAACLLAAAPVLEAGPQLLTGFTTYARHWSFNGLLFPWLEPVLGPAARPVLVGAAAGWVLWVAWRRDDPLETLAACGAAFVLTSPTVHPWYALWALWPALALGRWWWAIACTAILGGYGVLAGYDPSTGTWSEPAWLWWATWVPALAALAWASSRPDREASPTSP